MDIPDIKFVKKNATLGIELTQPELVLVQEEIRALRGGLVNIDEAKAIISELQAPRAML